MPLLGVEVEMPDVLEGCAGVTKSTVASVDEDLVVVERMSGIRSGCWCADGRLLVVFNILVSVNSLPSIVLNFEEPTVI